MPKKGRRQKEEEDDVEERNDADAKGLYATLGVEPKADVAEIRKSYRRLALRWHPDKNPDDPSATAEFQKISSAYECLSDPQRRDMYDQTGCVDADELEGDGFGHAEDLFAAFFGGGMDEDLDPEEQAMLDEFLRMAGGAAFKRGGRRRRKGGRGKASAPRSSAASSRMEEQMLSEMMAAMGGGMMGGMMGGMGGAMPSMVPEVLCPKDHPLKRRKADGAYECDMCSADIAEGKRIFECRKCDYSLCQKCQKAGEKLAAEAAEAEGEVPEFDEEDILTAFCEMQAQPVRDGGSLKFRCEICRKLLASQAVAMRHMKEQHPEDVESFGEVLRKAGPELGGGMDDDFEAFLMASAMEEMMGGLLDGGGPPRGGGGGRRKKR